MGIKQLSVIVVLIFSSANTVEGIRSIKKADSILTVNPPFSAICECIGAHGYRSGTDFLGNPIKDSWTTSEQFFSKWKFLYSGGDSIHIDGEKIPIIVQCSDVIMAGSSGVSWLGADVWTYAIHLGLRKIVACQVNAFGFAGSKLKGVKTRAVELDCVFQIHKSEQ